MEHAAVDGGTIHPDFDYSIKSQLPTIQSMQAARETVFLSVANQKPTMLFSYGVMPACSTRSLCIASNGQLFKFTL